MPSSGRLETSFASSSARSFISWEPAVGWYLCRRICLPSFEAVGSLWHLALSSVPRRRSRGWRALPASRCTASARSHPDRLPAAAPPLARRAGRRRAAPTVFSMESRTRAVAVAEADPRTKQIRKTEQYASCLVSDQCCLLSCSAVKKQ